MTKPVQVFILLGQSNMVGLGKVTGGEGSLENAVKNQKYPYLVDDAGAWTVRQDVRFVRFMSGKGPLNNEFLTVKGTKMGPEYGIGHPLGNAVDAPVMLLKACIGNRSLGWDLLPPGSERYEFEGKVYPAYTERPDAWVIDKAQGLATVAPPWLDKNGKPIDWYAGKQYDSDTADAKKVLSEIGTYYPEATKYEVAGFFFWQGEKDCGNPAHAAKYEENLVRFIKRLRQDFNAPHAKFVLATLGEKGVPGGDEKHFRAPDDLVFASNGDIYVADSGNGRIVHLNKSGQFVSQFGKKGKEKGQFATAHGLGIDSKDRIYVADRGNNRVQVFANSGEFLSVWDGFGNPFGLLVTGKQLLVSEGDVNKIFHFDLASGQIVNSWGDSQTLQLPHLMSTDRKGNLYVAEVNGKRVQIFRRK
jgi:DNA-binding beta-propeller fold protein YncE